MAGHGKTCFPKECCGIMLGTWDGESREVTLAIPCKNAYDGEQKDRFQLDPRDQLAADRRARELGLSVLGFFHSHPNEDSYFSSTDLANSWPWYSNVVMSIRDGEFAVARSFIANDDQTSAKVEEIDYPKEQEKWPRS